MNEEVSNPRSAQDGVPDRGWNDPPPICSNKNRSEAAGTKKRMNKRVPIPDSSIASTTRLPSAGIPPPILPPQSKQTSQVPPVSSQNDGS